MAQTIGAHSWGVAWLVSEFHEHASAKLLKACLEHDLPEYLTGDISYIAKGQYPELKQGMDVATTGAEVVMNMTSLDGLTMEEQWWLKWADLLEGAMWCRYLTTSFGFQLYMPRWVAYCDALKSHMTKASEFHATPSNDAVYFSNSIALYKEGI